MLPSSGLRAQLLIPEQRELYDYWLKAAGARRMPDRSDFDPCDVPKLLPHIALIEVPANPAEARFRVAGSALHDIYASEITGRRLDQVYGGDAFDYWQRVHDIVLQGVALQGVMRGPAVGREHVVMFWMRLPLAAAGSGTVSFILCHDCVPQSFEDWGDGSHLAPRFAPIYLAAQGLRKQAYN